MRLKNHKSDFIDQSEALSFIFNNKSYKGYKGDTLASALIANDVLFFARSFKYGRKRGLMGSGVEEPNALVSLEIGERYTPNLKATEVMLYDGLSAVSSSNPNSIDFRALIKPLHRFMPAGFYYKTFIKQKVWAMVEDSLRSLAGFSKAPTEKDKDVYDHIFHHTEVLVVGGGVAGITAALEILNNSKTTRVILVDERAHLGGELFNEFKSDDNAISWHYDNLNKLLEFKNVANSRLKLLSRSTAYAWYDHNYIEVLQTNATGESLISEGTQSARKVLHKIRAKEVILATGAHERPMLFETNDLANIMLSQSVRRYLNEFGVISGKDVILYGNNDSIYSTAIDINNNEINCKVIDIRPSGVESETVLKAKKLGIEVLQGYAVLKAHGTNLVKGIEVSSVEMQGKKWRLTSPSKRLNCDLLATSGGFNPVVHLDCHCGAKTFFDEDSQAFLPQKERKNRQVCGSISAIGFWQDAVIDAKNKAQLTLLSLEEIKKSTQDTMSENYLDYYNTSQFFVPIEILNRPKVFIDMQNDVTTLDVALAIREGYRSIEHIKRYTAMGFGTDQGKTGNINGIAVAAQFLDVPLSEVGTTTFRPAYTGVDFGAMAGREVGGFFDPQRYTTIHDSHLESGAEFEVVGQWYRPWYYPKGGEDIHQAVNRECLAVRTSLGMMDASTLGKIDVQGKDAREFLSRVYTNAWMKLAPGSCRYGLMCNEKGMIIDDGVSTCINDNHFIMTTTTGGAASVYSALEMWLQTEWSELDVHLSSVTDQFATVAVVGPNARNLMKVLCQDIDFERDNFKFMQWRPGTVCGVEARIMRISFSGELAYEINIEANYGRYIWDEVALAGKPWNITPYGTESMHILRAEKGYIIVGQDTDGSMTPMDVNMKWILAKDKPFSYIGRRSFSISALNSDDRFQLVGLLTKDTHVVLPEGSHIINNKGSSIGYVTSSYFSPILRRSIAMAQLKGGLSKMTEIVLVKIVQEKQGLKEIPCEVSSSVFYDIKGEKVDGNE
ncbi:2Fe-2S iron-sulfur cluster-binding protein [Candidatus Pseudothioglobus sp. Uisw_016]|uniref:2Fe-2S iron-sulfur cluster-binding protein n=1 Tax=Candidatus Pseudothioglobus sp. Uisw_016 TaxID=3230995 RepID=UPI003A88FE33